MPDGQNDGTMPPEPRARVVSAAPAPPREVEYRDDFEDDRPTVRRVRKRGTLPSLIIYAFVGGMIGFVPVAWYFFSTMMSMTDMPGNQATYEQRAIGSVMRSLIPGAVAFVVCAAAASFVWAMTRSRR